MSNEHIASSFLVDIDGESYEFVPLKLKDIIGSVTDYLRMQPVAALLKQRDAFEAEVFEEMLDSAKKEAREIEFGTRRFNEEAFKASNIVYMLWLSLRKTHTEIKFPEFQKLLLSNSESFSHLIENLERVIVISDSTPRKDDSPTRKKDSSSKGKKKIVPST